MRNYTGLLHILTIITLLILSSYPINTTNAWIDTFHQDGIPQDWDCFAYRRGNDTGEGPLESVNDEDYQIRVRDGILGSLTYDKEDEGGYYAIHSAAYRDSHQVHGKWSFDWIIGPGSIDHFLFSLASDQNLWDAEGSSEFDFFFGDKIGYMLTLVSTETEQNGIFYFQKEMQPDNNRLNQTGPRMILTTIGSNPQDRYLYGMYYIGWHNFDEDIVGLHHIDITHDKDNGISVYYDGDFLMNYYGFSGSVVQSSEKIGYISIYGNSGIDNLELTNDTIIVEETTEPPLLEIAIVGGSLGILTLFVQRKNIRNKFRNIRQKRHMAKTESILHTFSDIFSPSQLVYLAAITQSNSAESQSVAEKEIPDNLKEYGYLMHPVRLSIMKLLHKNFSMTSVDIKHKVNISWGAYSSHISSLEKHGFISIVDNFQDGIKVNVVVLEERGRIEYENLFSLLKDYLEDDAPDYYEDKFEVDNLYPNND